MLGRPCQTTGGSLHVAIFLSLWLSREMASCSESLALLQFLFHPVILFRFSLSGVPLDADASVTSLVNTDVQLRSRGCLFEVSVILPSGATFALEGNRNTDTVGSLVAKLSDNPELRGHTFYAMHGGSYLNPELTLQNYNVQERSELRILHRDALPGGVTDAYLTMHREPIGAGVTSAMSNVLHDEPPDPVSAIAQRLGAQGVAPGATTVPHLCEQDSRQDSAMLPRQSTLEAAASTPLSIARPEWQCTLDLEADTLSGPIPLDASDSLEGGQGAGAPSASTFATSAATVIEAQEHVPPVGSASASLVLPCLQLEGHVKARGQDNPNYPTRQPVRDELVPWDMPFPDYSPEVWTHGDVLANNRELNTGHKWADPPDAARAGLAQRVSYAGNGLPKPLVLGADGKPRNPVGRTGLRDRGLLGKWGPNHAADPLVTRYHPETEKLQMVAIRRKDTGQWAIPGGMVDDGETISATLRREFTEEAGNIADGPARAAFDTQVSLITTDRHSMLAILCSWSCIPSIQPPLPTVCHSLPLRVTRHILYDYE